MVMHLCVCAPGTHLLRCHSDGLQQGLVEDTLLTAVGVGVNRGAHTTVHSAVRCKDTIQTLKKPQRLS